MDDPIAQMRDWLLRLPPFTKYFLGTVLLLAVLSTMRVVPYDQYHFTLELVFQHLQVHLRLVRFGGCSHALPSFATSPSVCSCCYTSRTISSGELRSNFSAVANEQISLCCLRSYGRSYLLLVDSLECPFLVNASLWLWL